MKISNQSLTTEINTNFLHKKYKIRTAIIPWVFLAPGIFFTLILRYYTIFQSFKIAFFRYDLSNPPGKFVGLDNFKFLFKDENFIQSWKNTLIFIVLILLLNFCVPIIQALLLSEIDKMRNLFSTFYILPAVIPLTVNIILWKWVYDPTYGIANYILKLFGGQPQEWLSDVNLVKFCIVLPGIIGGGINVLLYLAAILGISEDIKEAAALDGCTGFMRMFHITIPNIRFLILIQFILATVYGFQILDLPFQFTKGGPGVSAQSTAIYIYNKFMVSFDYGTSSAAAMVLMVVIAIITYIQLKLSNEEKE